MELLDTYFDQYQKTGRVVDRNDCKNLPADEYLMVVHLCVFNSRGEMLIQKRQLHKDRYPGMWDISAGGFVQSGESISNAVLREACEELGVEFAPESIRYIMTVPFSFVLDGFFSVHTDHAIGDFNPQPEEVIEVKWATLEDILALRENEQFTPFTPEYLKLLFFMKDRHDVME